MKNTGIQKEKIKIAIVGTGLIGCSMAEGLRDAAGEIVGVDNNTGHLQEALYRGWIDRSMSLEKAVSCADLVIISVPVDAAIKLLPGILDLVGDRTVVIDAGSVKSAICQSVKDHSQRTKFVAAHPMAGLAVSGPEASDAGLFRNRKVVICEHDKTSEHALNMASFVFDRLGMDIINMEPEVHDLYVAQISHLPQVVAYCLSAITEVSDDKRESMINIASSGFESSTRLASSPAGMWIPIFEHNSEFLAGSIDDMIGRLSEIRNLIKEKNWKSLTRLIEKANRSREKFLSAYKHL